MAYANFYHPEVPSQHALTHLINYERPEGMTQNPEYKNGYARGYAAGQRRRLKVDAGVLGFRDQVFLAALQGYLAGGSGWGRGEGEARVLINNIPECVRLAWKFADEAGRTRQ